MDATAGAAPNFRESAAASLPRLVDTCVAAVALAAAGRGAVRVVLYPHVPGALRELSHALHCCPAAMQCV